MSRYGGGWYHSYNYDDISLAWYIHKPAHLLFPPSQNYVQRRLLKGKKSNVRGAAYLLLTVRFVVVLCYVIYNDTNNCQNFSVLASLFAGSLAGAVTVLLTQPMDNIVTRIQVDSSEGSAYYHSRQRYCSVVYSVVMEQLSNHQMIREYEKSIYRPTISLFHLCMSH